MGGFIKRDVDRIETTALNQKVNKELLNQFRDYCKIHGFPMNVALEVFMLQYADGRFNLSSGDILKWKGDESETETLNSTFSKDTYLRFKCTCKSNGFFVKHVVMAFMEKFSSGSLRMEYVDENSIN